MEPEGGVFAVNVKVHSGLFHIPLAAGLDRVLQADLVGIAAADTHAANRHVHVHRTPGDEVAGVTVGLFVVPVIGKRRYAEGGQNEAEQEGFSERAERESRSWRHETPRRHKHAGYGYGRGRGEVPGKKR